MKIVFTCPAGGQNINGIQYYRDEPKFESAVYYDCLPQEEDVILRSEELEFAREYCHTKRMESLSREQMKLILDRGRSLHRWYKEHQKFHYALSMAVLL